MVRSRAIAEVTTCLSYVYVYVYVYMCVYMSIYIYVYMQRHVVDITHASYICIYIITTRPPLFTTLATATQDPYPPDSVRTPEARPFPKVASFGSCSLSGPRPGSTTEGACNRGIRWGRACASAIGRLRKLTRQDKLKRTLLENSVLNSTMPSVCMYMYAAQHIHIYMCVYVYTCVYMHMDVYMYIHIHTHVGLDAGQQILTPQSLTTPGSEPF